MDGAVRVVDRTTTLTPAAPGESVTGGYVSVAKVTGDPEAIVDAYVRQGKYPGEIFADTYEANGHPVIQKWWDSAGGPKLYVTATTDDSNFSVRGTGEVGSVQQRKGTSPGDEPSRQGPGGLTDGATVKKLFALLAVLTLLAAACGDRGDDTSGGVQDDGGGAATTAPNGEEEAEPGDWGDLKAVCGPNEGGGKVAADDAQGVSEDSIEITTVADPGFSGSPGLNQELFDASDAFVDWCNDAGGINGKTIKLNKRDSKLTDYQPVIEAACKTDFALVGGGAVQDNLWPTVGAKCDLIDVAGFAVTPEKAGKAGDSPMDGRTVQALPNPSDQYPVGPAKLLEDDFPDLGEHLGFLSGDFQTLTVQRDKEAAAYESIGYKPVYDGTYAILGESNWKPFATAMQEKDVSLYKFIGEPVNAANVEQAFSQIGFVPDVRLYEPNIYDQSFLDAAGPAAEGAFIGNSLVPLEEADENPATQLYLDNMDKQGGKVAVLGVQSTSAWLLFATVAKQCDLDDDLTRGCILKGAAEVTEWTGGGLHSPGSPATNEGSDCWMVLEVKDEEFTRRTPAEGFTCDPSFQAEIPK